MVPDKEAEVEKLDGDAVIIGIIDVSEEGLESWVLGKVGVELLDGVGSNAGEFAKEDFELILKVADFEIPNYITSRINCVTKLHPWNEQIPLLLNKHMQSCLLLLQDVFFVAQAGGITHALFLFVLP